MPDLSIPNQEPTVIIKSEAPFFLSPKFLIPSGFVLFLLLATGIGSFLLKVTPSKLPPAQMAREKPIKPLKGLIGTVLAVDSQKSILTVNSEGKQASFPVSNEVLISQIVFKLSDTPGKQFSLPTTILYLEDLENKKGEEVNLVFDETGEKIAEIQMYNKQGAQK